MNQEYQQKMLFCASTYKATDTAITISRKRFINEIDHQAWIDLLQIICDFHGRRYAQN